MQSMKATIITAVLISGVASQVLAERHKGPIQRLDTDQDGQISFTEFEAPPNPLFGHADSDGDERVSAEELAALHQRQTEETQARLETRRQQAEAMFVEMDGNNDGAVSAEEMREHAFARLDSDGDGYVTRQEFRQRAGQGGRMGKGRHRRDQHDR